jgi:hypothetical protein
MESSMMKVLRPVISLLAFIGLVSILSTLAILSSGDISEAPKAKASSYIPHKFTFEEVAVRAQDALGNRVVYVAYVLRTDNARAFAVVNVNCSIYADNKLIGSDCDMLHNVNAAQRIHGRTYGSFLTKVEAPKPDRAECTAQPLEF